MKVIPAIDVYENKVVRLEKGDFNKVKVYADSAIEQSKIFNSHGFKYLHIVDLIGSKTGSINIKGVIKQIKSGTGLEIQFGGGIRNYETAKDLIDLGVSKIIIGSLSIINQNEFEKIISIAGADKIIIAADVINENIAVKGWTENSRKNLFEHIDYCVNLGIEEFLCTDISKDGMLSGTNLELYRRIMNQNSKIKLIASGGIKDIEDVKKVKEASIYGAVVGRAIYENKINLKELVKIDC